jgi:hypothetical protein
MLPLLLPPPLCARSSSSSRVARARCPRPAEGERTDGLTLEPQQYLQLHPGYKPPPPPEPALPTSTTVAISAAAAAIATAVAAGAGGTTPGGAPGGKDSSKAASAKIAAETDDLKPNALGLYECTHPGCPKVSAVPSPRPPPPTPTSHHHARLALPHPPAQQHTPPHLA